MPPRSAKPDGRVTSRCASGHLLHITSPSSRSYTPSGELAAARHHMPARQHQGIWATFHAYARAQGGAAATPALVACGCTAMSSALIPPYLPVPPVPPLPSILIRLPHKHSRVPRCPSFPPIFPCHPSFSYSESCRSRLFWCCQRFSDTKGGPAPHPPPIPASLPYPACTAAHRGPLRAQ